MGRRVELAGALVLLEQAERLVNDAIAEVGAPIPKGVPSAGLRASIDRTRDSIAAAVRACGDELRYLERLDMAHPVTADSGRGEP